MEQGQQQQQHGADNDSRMDIREDELAWAHQIKATIKADGNLNNLSDYEYAQWAIVTLARQDMAEVLDRVYKMQCFLEEYKILQSSDVSYVEEGLELIQGLMDMMPGFILSIDYMPSQGHYVFVDDLSAFYPSKIKTEHDWRTYLGAYYFIFQFTHSNLAAARAGVACIVECMDMGFQNYSPSAIERTASHLFSFLPLNQRESMWLNTPTVANVLIGCVKPFLPNDINRTFQLGCKLDGFEGKIDALFSAPSQELAREALKRKCERFLTERQRNQHNFVLPPLPPQVLGP